MAREIAIKCDGCGTRKGETNHWWMAARVLNGGGLYLTLADPRIEAEPTMKDYCSEACVIKAVSEWMGAKRQA